MTDSTSVVAERVHDLLAPVVATAGVELVDIEWVGGTLRVVIDQEGGVTTERLTAVNRLVSPLLDQHDPVPGKYLLEVSSPGVERTLRRQEHFVRAVGEQVVVKLFPGSDPRRVRGELVEVDESSITIQAVEVDGIDLAAPERHKIDLVDINKARTTFNWGPTPKKGGKAKNKPKTNTPKNKTKSKTKSQSKSAKNSERKQNRTNP